MFGTLLLYVCFRTFHHPGETRKIIRLALEEPVRLEYRVSLSPQVSIRLGKKGKKSGLLQEILAVLQEAPPSRVLSSVRSFSDLNHGFIWTYTEGVIPPNLVWKLSNIHHIMGSLVNLECGVEGFLPLSVEWSKGEFQLSNIFNYVFL